MFKVGNNAHLNSITTNKTRLHTGFTVSLRTNIVYCFTLVTLMVLSQHMVQRDGLKTLTGQLLKHGDPGTLMSKSQAMLSVMMVSILLLLRA